MYKNKEKETKEIENNKKFVRGHSTNEVVLNTRALPFLTYHL